jgi:ubiquinone/menaquinone biosynthesis C-methylase UbiE
MFWRGGVFMQRAEYTSANRRAWNEAAPVHDKYRLTQVMTDFRQPGYNSLSATASQILKQIGIEGKAVAQLCCNNGRELIAIKNLGAGRCVGFDISDNFVEQARDMAQASDVACEFVRTDVYDISSEYDGNFDLIYISVGTLGWMPDIKAFFQIASRLLRPGGWMAVYEMHPLLDMFEGDDTNDPPILQHSYFRTNPYVEDNGLDYYGMTAIKSSPSYWFHHTTSDIIDGCLSASMQLRSFQEYDHDISNVFARFEQMKLHLPLSYSLVTQKV